MGEIWGLIPDSARFQLPGAGGLENLTLVQESFHIARGAGEARCILRGLPLHLLQAEGEPVITGAGPELGQLLLDSQEDAGRIALQREQLRRWLAQYPSLIGWDFVHNTEPDKPIGFTFDAATTRLEMPLRLPNVTCSANELENLQRRAFTYHSTMMVYPTLDGTVRAAHPFILWWAVLYLLSMLARYQPREWTQLIDVSHAPEAVAIEYFSPRRCWPCPRWFTKSSSRLRRNEPEISRPILTALGSRRVSESTQERRSCSA